MATSSRLLTRLACAAVLLAASPARAVEAGLSKSAETLVDMRVLHVLLEAYESEGGRLPVTDGALLPIPSLDPLRRGFYRERCPLRDAWGNALLFGSDGRHALLVSLGPDGRADQAYDPSRMYERDFLSARGPDDIVLLDGQVAQLPPDPSARVLRTIAATVDLARAIERFRQARGAYPGPTPGPVDDSTLDRWIDNADLSFVGPASGELFVWSTDSGYLIVSPGEDRAFDQDYAGARFPPTIRDAGPTSNPSADIVLLNGEFVKWPAGAPFRGFTDVRAARSEPTPSSGRPQ